MDRVTVAFVVIAAGLFGIWGGSCLARAWAEAPPPDPAQVRPDIFPCNGCNMQDFNPTTRKAKSTRSVAYRVVTLSGCSAGRIPSDLEAMNVHTQESVGLDIQRNDAAYDFTVYISCGLTQINKCGSVNVFCLPSGFPGNTDVYLSDVLSGYDAGSRLGIPLHEIVGHATGTWNEQYAVCGASCGFASTPGLRDYMNTGPLSRHGFEASECGRWMRTMWEDPPCAFDYGYAAQTPPDCSGPTVDWGGGVTATWDPCLGRWEGSNGYGYEVATGIWYDHGVRWLPCTAWGGRDNPDLGISVHGGVSVFSWAYGRWFTSPSC